MRTPAGLTFGDCMSYAAAELAGGPLQAIGEGSSKTDLEFGDGIVRHWPRHRRPPKA